MKKVIITGANGNLGTATVKRFLSEGYKVIAIDGSDSHLSFAKGNSNFEFRTVDLTNEEASSEFVHQVIQTHGRVDAALMLVGGFAAGDLTNTTGTDLHKMFSLNFETAFYITKPLHQHMSGNGYGRLVFIGARPAIEPSQGKGLLSYALSKSLLFRFAEFLNASSKATNVVASVVIPSTIDTPLNRQSMPEANPDNWVKAEQIADVLEMICSEKGMPLRESVYKVYNNS